MSYLTHEKKNINCVKMKQKKSIAQKSYQKYIF